MQIFKIRSQKIMFTRQGKLMVMVKDKSVYSKRMLLVIYSTFFEYFLFTTFVIYSKSITAELLHNSDNHFRHLIALMIFLTASIARPIGGILFSAFGDSIHRSRIFFFTAIIMSLSSLIIAAIPALGIPTYWVVLILLGARVLQGIAVGAEIPEGIVFCYENARPESRVMVTNFTTLALGFGLLFAVLSSMISEAYFSGAGWRASLIIISIIGLILTPLLHGSFEHTKRKAHELNFDALKEIFATHKLSVLRLVCFSTFLSSATAVFLYVMPDYLRDYFNYSEHDTHISLIFVASSFLSGSICAVFIHNKLGKSFYLLSGLFLKGLLVFVFHSYMHHSLLETTILNSICIFIFGFFIAKLPALIASSFPSRIRYTGIALVYNISFGVMYAITQILINWLIVETKSLYMPSMYIIFFSYISLASLWFMSKESFFNYNK